MHDIPHIQAKMILTKLYKQITFQSVCPICPGSWPLNLLKCLSNLSWLLATKIHVHQLLISAYIKIALKPSFTYSCIQVLGQLINKYKHHVYLNQSNPNHTYIYVMRLRQNNQKLVRCNRHEKNCYSFPYQTCLLLLLLLPAKVSGFRLTFL